MLDFEITAGKEHEWSSVSPRQASVKADLDAWGSRTGIDVTSAPFVGLGLWGDSAPCSNKGSLYLLTSQVLTGEHNGRHWFAGFGKKALCRCGCFGRHTVDRVLQVYVWSVLALIAGENPSCGPDQEPLGDEFRRRRAGSKLRFRGTLLYKKGDWAWLKQICNMVGWRGEGVDKRVCFRCPASLRGTAFCYDFGPDAIWKGMCCDQGYLASCLWTGTFVCSLFSLPGFDLSCIRLDFMHICCLGVLQYVNGHALYDMCCFLGGVKSNTAKAAMVCGLMVNMLKIACKSMGIECPIHQLSIGMIVGKAGNPKLKVKAAEGRYLLPVILEVLKRFLPCASPHEVLRMQCLGALTDVYTEIRSWQEDGSSAARFRERGQDFLILYGELAKSAGWRLYPKMHLLAHIFQSSDECPSVTWNYGDEDEIGRGALMCFTVHPNFISTKLLERYRLSKRKS